MRRIEHWKERRVVKGQFICTYPLPRDVDVDVDAFGSVRSSVRCARDYDAFECERASGGSRGGAKKRWRGTRRDDDDDDDVSK